MLIKQPLLILFLWFTSISTAMALGEQESNWRGMLNSINQAERDSGANKLRGVFKPTDKEVWTKKLSWVKPKISLVDLEKRLVKLGIDTSKTLGGACGGGSCSRT